MRTILAILCVPLFACDLSASDVAGLLRNPFGEVSGRAVALDEDGIERVMNTAVGRFRAWTLLREALPFSLIADHPCGVETTDPRGGFLVTTDIACAVGGDASGVVTLRQENRGGSPQVLRFTINYDAVLVPTLSVAGSEALNETINAERATLHEVDLVVSGETLRFSFRSGLLDGSVPVFDFVVAAPDGDVTVRLTNPTSPGALASVFVTGTDGVLMCELRDSDWSLSPRGTCDNGIVFGLP